MNELAGWKGRYQFLPDAQNVCWSVEFLTKTLVSNNRAAQSVEPWEVGCKSLSPSLLSLLYSHNVQGLTPKFFYSSAGFTSLASLWHASSSLVPRLLSVNRNKTLPTGFNFSLLPSNRVQRSLGTSIIVRLAKFCFRRASFSNSNFDSMFGVIY